LGDIGGTNARLKAFDINNNELICEKNYLSHNFPSLEHVIIQFKRDFDLNLSIAVLALAGRITE
jgi:glucokinase